MMKAGSNESGHSKIEKSRKVCLEDKDIDNKQGFRFFLCLSLNLNGHLIDLCWWTYYIIFSIKSMIPYM